MTPTGLVSTRYTEEFARAEAPKGYEWLTLPQQPYLWPRSLPESPEAKALSCTRCGVLVADYEVHNKAHEKKAKIKTLVGQIGEDGQCPNCGATDIEADRANAEGNALFSVMCGCDSHGDHGGCRRDCRDYLGCTQKIKQETVCDHSY